MSKIASIFELESSAKSAISDFFRATERLKKLGIFRSDQYLGDLGEYLARLCFSIEPVESCREEGHDGKDGEGRKVQVKFHNSKKGNNINLGNPEKYDIVVIVLGPESKLRNTKHGKGFLLYGIPSEQAREMKKKKNGYSCGALFFEKEPDYKIFLE